MQNTLSRILKLASDLTKSELMTLNQAVVSLIKAQQDVDFKKAAITFIKGNIVSFKDSDGIRVQGVITKKNPKTLQVTMQDKLLYKYSCNLCNASKKPFTEIIGL